jgi:hypothetical protein
MVKCGYGWIEWPDRTIIDSYWFDGKAIGPVHVRTSENNTYQGYWQKDKGVGLDVFRHV